MLIALLFSGNNLKNIIHKQTSSAYSHDVMQPAAAASAAAAAVAAAAVAAAAVAAAAVAAVALR